MISVEEALLEILSYVHVLDSEDKPLLESMGQVLAEDVYSALDIPPLDNSAMDGYAVQAESTSGASQSSPVALSVIGEIAAGYLPKKEVVSSTAIRIMTGAPVPRGADTVVQFEDTDEEQRKVQGKPLTEIGIMREVKVGLNIRRKGEDISKGNLVLKAGGVLRPQEIGVLASLGKVKVSVTRRPVVAILSTGDELVNIGNPLPAGKIYNSNTYSLAAQVSNYGGIPKILGIAKDNIRDLEEKVALGQDADLFLTSAGVSVGEYDVVKDVLARQGEIGFWTVRMKPGKPLAFGVLKIGGRIIPHLGLPGNPVSSMVVFEQFARPAILKMRGKRNFAKPVIQAQSGSRVNNTDRRRVFVRVRVEERQGQYFAQVTGPQGSGILTSMAQANGLMIVPEDVSFVEEGDKVCVQMLDWSQELQAE
ncbi:gephyrin-like molybdotransferase Glp [Chloroflexota bacterium]